ncbi:predicted protein [Verticillium alfalfae VaMs.102]|uniref:Predicted protein n=1 Tax=Verticillium alfalfae (strain VaMs.102 / ATCC MYA-4576 / FGSC 10136) TaxID=526221 RepID=C9SHK1_VERA1|nr:predicted protein [Verticillium alfalfae VaMs.102]EEY18424.1 predicted protein [Verticillium alfalfae VaMs.102]
MKEDRANRVSRVREQNRDRESSKLEFERAAETRQLATSGESWRWAGLYAAMKHSGEGRRRCRAVEWWPWASCIFRGFLRLGSDQPPSFYRTKGYCRLSVSLGSSRAGQGREHHQVATLKEAIDAQPGTVALGVRGTCVGRQQEREAESQRARKPETAKRWRSKSLKDGAMPREESGRALSKRALIVIRYPHRPDNCFSPTNKPNEGCQGGVLLFTVSSPPPARQRLFQLPFVRRHRSPAAIRLRSISSHPHPDQPPLPLGSSALARFYFLPGSPGPTVLELGLELELMPPEYNLGFLS